MQIDGIKDTAFNASIKHGGTEFYVANGLKGDVPVSSKGYLVMVNENGDRVAFRAPDGDWEIDDIMHQAYKPEIPHYVNAVHVHARIEANE
ncbi:hypothetical protein [Enterobacter asburiae]|uniref:hypothetical protein n=1 Tax=Enterobacter asburiae TaxID=61645 RepID=UPI002A8121D2|nr:hypothetical protein [Enterobacter asburiae]